MNTSRDSWGQASRLTEVYAACLCAMLGIAPAVAQQANTTSVGNFQVQAGAAALAANADAAKVTINLSSAKSVLQWDRLNVPIGATLQFSQPNAQSVVLNRVVSVDPARIDGVMNANGQVWILSGSGILFGANSKVDVQGLMASTRDISNADFLAGKYTFNGGGSGKVSNLGDIAVADGGYVLLVGSEVDNQGRIQAQLGQVKLASGKAFVLDLQGDKLLRFDVTEALTGSDGQAAKLSNAGQILAEGGSIQMTARAANGLVAQVVNTGGLLQANSARWVNGDIVLDAGPGGEVTAGGQISAQGLVSGTKGGNVTVVGDSITLPADARINASGQAGGGQVLVGGDWQGSGSLQQAKTLDMQAGAEIKANATTAGDGGKVVLWSDVNKADSLTSIAGSIDATGGPFAGNGGRVETSGHQVKIADSFLVNSNSPKGQGGQWLIDPVDFTISASGGDMTGTALSNNLANSNVTLTTSVGSSGSINVSDNVAWSANQLFLTSDKNVNINALMTLSGTAGVSFSTANGGAVLVGLKPNAGGFNGRVDLSATTGSLTINGNTYTVIKSVADLNAANTASWGNTYYALGTNLNGASITSPLANGGFNGSFNGLGNVISGVAISGGSYVGLFAKNYGLISNIGLSGTVNGTAGVGGLVGLNQSATITNAYSTADINASGSEVGGLVGINQDATITNSFATGNVSAGLQNIGGLVGTHIAPTGTSTIQSSYALGNVSGVNNIGGLAGVSYGYGGSALISNSYASGAVTSSGGSQVGVLIGGLVGVMDANNAANSKSIVEYSYATGNVTGSYLVGGLVGQLSQLWGESRISSSYATGNVAGTHSTMASNGGLLGENLYGTVGNSYATGSVTSQSLTATIGTGGLVGTNIGAIANTYATGAVTGNGYSGALVGLNKYNSPTLKGQIQTSYASGSVNGVANSGVLVGVSDANTTIDASNIFLNNAASNNQASYAGFDFANTWAIYEGYTNPLLRSFMTPITVTVSSPANKVFDGTNAVAVTETYSITRDPAKTWRSPTFTLSGSSVGSQNVVTTGAYYSDQQGYLISLVNNTGAVTVNPANGGQNIQIAMASATSALTELASSASTPSAIVTPSASSTSSAIKNSVATTTTTTTTSDSQNSSTSPASTSATVSTVAANQSAVTTATATATTPDVATISVSNQNAEVANLNAANTAVSSTPNSTLTAGAASTAIPKPQVTMVSMNALNVSAPTSVGAQTIAAIQTPKAPEDQRDPVLAAVGNFKPPAVLSSAGRSSNAKGRDTPVVVPLVQGVLSFETAPPKAASQTVDEQRLSGAGNRSRW